jgi:hypothetical protein
MKSPHSTTQSSSNQEVLICRRKCDSRSDVAEHDVVGHTLGKQVECVGEHNAAVTLAPRGSESGRCLSVADYVRAHGHPGGDRRRGVLMFPTLSTRGPSSSCSAACSPSPRRPLPSARGSYGVDLQLVAKERRRVSGRTESAAGRRTPRGPSAKIESPLLLISLNLDPLGIGLSGCDRLDATTRSIRWRRRNSKVLSGPPTAAL